MVCETCKVFLTDIIKKPPILFPLVGLFHILLLLWTIWGDHHEPFPRYSMAGSVMDDRIYNILDSSLRFSEMGRY